MHIPLPKLKAIIKYFCSNTNENFLGKTKLLKLFYFLDFTHIKKYGLPITGDRYYHLEHGPIPSMIKNLVDNLEDTQEAILSDTIEIIKNDNSLMHKIKCFLQYTEKDNEYFCKIELETLKKVCQRFKESSTKDIVDISHKEAAWEKTKEVEEIPYTLAVDDDDCSASKEDIELLNKL